MSIQFPSSAPEFRGWNLTVGFAALVDGSPVDCAVSAEALEDHCGASSPGQADLLHAFTTHRAKIEDLARRLLQDSKCKRLLLHSGHFRYHAAA